MRLFIGREAVRICCCCGRPWPCCVRAIWYAGWELLQHRPSDSRWQADSAECRSQLMRRLSLARGSPNVRSAAVRRAILAGAAVATTRASRTTAIAAAAIAPTVPATIELTTVVARILAIRRIVVPFVPVHPAAAAAAWAALAEGVDHVDHSSSRSQNSSSSTGSRSCRHTKSARLPAHPVPQPQQCSPQLLQPQAGSQHPPQPLLQLPTHGQIGVYVAAAVGMFGKRTGGHCSSFRNRSTVRVVAATSGLAASVFA